MQLIAVATSKKERDRLARKYLKQHLYTPARVDEVKEDLKQIAETGQTQSFSMRLDLEIYTETIETNVIL